MLRIKVVDLYPIGTFNNDLLRVLREHFGEVEWSDNPDFLFYSVNGYEHLNYDCVRIFFTGENIVPDFNICDYALGFCRMQFGDRYLRFPHYLDTKYKLDYQRALQKHLLKEEDLLQKRKFCNFVVSNDWGASDVRVNFFNLLSTYKQVDSGGRTLNNIGGPIADKYEFQKQYKFSIAFENTSTEGYVTEKILQAFAAGTIPIYWGDSTVIKDFNAKSFINCHDYASFEDVVERVKEIDKNDELFHQYLREPIFTKDTFISIDNLPAQPDQSFWNYVINICSQAPVAAQRRCNLMFGKWWQDDQRKLREWKRWECVIKRILLPWRFLGKRK